jgi:hypothetical protein
MHSTEDTKPVIFVGLLSNLSASMSSIANVTFITSLSVTVSGGLGG